MAPVAPSRGEQTIPSLARSLSSSRLSQLLLLFHCLRSLAARSLARLLRPVCDLARRDLRVPHAAAPSARHVAPKLLSRAAHLPPVELSPDSRRRCRVRPRTSGQRGNKLAHCLASGRELIRRLARVSGAERPINKDRPKKRRKERIRAQV